MALFDKTDNAKIRPKQDGSKRQAAEEQKMMTFKEGIKDALSFIIATNFQRDEAVALSTHNVRSDAAMEAAYADYVV